MKLNPEQFDLREVLDDVAAIASPLARDKALALSVEVAPELLLWPAGLDIVADRTRLRQVLLNLVSNAIKFTERGEVQVSVLRQNNTFTLQVRDTGLGIPAAQLKTIFEAFNQVDTSATRKVGGTGLGLTISRHLIEMHGGRLWAESRGVAGEGSQFFIELPTQTEMSAARDD